MGVTIKQIAQEVGLSWPAVSQILNQRGRFAPETRKKVLAVAARHGYRPNSSARALRDQSSKLIGVLFRNDADNALTNMSAFESLIGINLRFQEADLGTLVIRAGEIAQSGDIEPRVFRERLVDGVIVVGALPDPLIARVRALSQRVIWLDAPVWEDTCCIRRDEFAAGHACTIALADLGYKRIAFIARSAIRQSHHSGVSRLDGALAAARARHLGFELINWPEQEHESEFAELQRVLNPEVGIVAGSLPVARLIVHGANTLGKCMGYDYGIVSCDDSFETQTNWQPLSRVTFSRYTLGEKAAEMMLALIANPESPPPSRLIADPWAIGCSAWGPNFRSA